MSGNIYTCPMHPQIGQEGPGSCPICGMTLEPLQTGSEPNSNADLTDMTRRFWFALIFGVPAAAGVLYPSFGILLSLIIAAAAVALSSVSVISNSLRLYSAKL